MVGDWIGFVVKVSGLNQDQVKLLSRVTWVAVMTFHVLWVCGWLAWLGLAAPFANATTVTSVEQKVDALRKVSVEKDIIQMRGYQCRAKSEEAIQQYTRQLQELIDHYVDITHRSPWIPDCRDTEKN